MSFRALVVEKDAGGATHASVQTLDDSRLPDGDVTVSVEYTTLNYKDGLCLGSGGGMVRAWPHVPGVDFAGVVESSDHPRWKAGDRVILTGWRVGESRWGGYAAKARVQGDWLVELPQGLDTRLAMALGTPGLTAVLALQALEAHGLGPGPVLITGAAGGVGSVCVLLFSTLGLEVVALTGRAETVGYLRGLGAARIVARSDLEQPFSKALDAETWAGAVDNAGGAVLSRLLLQMKRGAAVASVGLAGGASFSGSVTPFILRGVSLLGIDSVMVPVERRVAAWARLAEAMPRDSLEAMIVPARLEDLPELGKRILAGQVRGRVVVDVRA